MYAYLYVFFVNPTDELNNAIKLLKTDYNSLICLLEIDQVIFIDPNYSKNLDWSFETKFEKN
jgi:hypothetical protein